MSLFYFSFNTATEYKNILLPLVQRETIELFPANH